DFDLLFPSKQDSLDPIIPKNTFFSFATIQPVAPAFADSIYFDFLKDTIAIPEVEMPDQFNGSNNWAVDSSKTKSKFPILCSDPHLKISNPSVWYEMQISTPSANVYGASFPGAPGIIIGFNDSCAFGFTNAGRDVKDYYEIKFKDNSKSEYWFNNKWVNTTRRIEKINIAGKPSIYDTVAYTIFGPVIYDASFSGKNNQVDKSYAVRWSAHDNSNEFKFFYLLNHAKNYSDFQQALPYLKSPGQNCVFACKNGDIALHVQGAFPAKWKGQGEFVMPGFDSSYMWQGMIPQSENPFQYNPVRGFVSSANQLPVDSAYPYYIGSNYPVYRGLYLNRKLSSMKDITTADMMKLQTSNYNVFAEIATPIILKNISVEVLNDNERKYFQKLENWGFEYDVNTTAASIFELTWSKLTDTIYNDEYANKPKNTARPYKSSLLDALLRDSSYKFIDDITTTNKETIEDVVTAAFKSVSLEAIQLEKQNKLSWAKYKDTHVDHLLKLPGFGAEHLKIGGNENCLNATKSSHGPSWRMIVNLTPNTDAYGIYPGGQSGNPGSRFYDDGIETCAK
ncbi:MAG: penicillin acylase family protein, partial [Sphingobacteriales bacterium]|nr:penicillin acylase family protein [Sphingobacteriales bacterium]